MKALVFAGRNVKEILRDPTNLFFGLGFPLAILVMLSIVNQAIPPEANNTMYMIEKTAPGIATFGTAFFALFAGMLLAKDRTSSFLLRLLASPLAAPDFIAGYTLPLLIMALAQGSITFLAAALFGLPLTANTLVALLTLLPISLLFVGLGLLCGSFLSDKAVGGVCGALLTNVAGWFSGIWIPLDLIGGVFRHVAHALPFYHAAEASKYAISGDYASIMSHLAVVLGYAAVCYGLAVLAFRHKMRSDEK